MKKFFRLIAKIIAIIALIILIAVLVYAGQVGFAAEVLGMALSTWGILSGGALVIAFVISPRGAEEGAKRVINGVSSAAKSVAKTAAGAAKGAGEGLAEGLGLKEIAKFVGIGVGVLGIWWLVSRGNDDAYESKTLPANTKSDSNDNNKLVREATGSREASSAEVHDANSLGVVF